MKNDIIKKLSEVYFKKIDKHILDQIIKKIEEVVPLKYFEKASIEEVFMEKYLHAISQNEDDMVVTFNEYARVDDKGWYYILDILKIDKLSNCDEKKAIGVRQFKYFEKSDTFKELMLIEDMPDYKNIDTKICAIKYFRKGLSADLEDYEELSKLSKVIYDKCYVNKYILEYNNDVSELLDRHKYGANIKGLLLKFTGGETLGYIEIDEEFKNNCEMMVFLHLDTCDLTYDNDHIIYEGQMAFAMFQANGLSTGNDDEFKRVAQKIEDTIDKCSTIQTGFEITTNITNDDTQYFISVNEFKTALDRQLFNLKKNADVIFTNLLKLLYLLDENYAYEEIA